MCEVRKKDGKDRNCFGTAPEKVSSLRWQSGAAAVRTGDPIQGIGLVCDGLCRKIEREGWRNFGLIRSARQKGFAREGISGKRDAFLKETKEKKSAGKK